MSERLGKGIYTAAHLLPAWTTTAQKQIACISAASGVKGFCCAVAAATSVCASKDRFSHSDLILIHNAREGAKAIAWHRRREDVDLSSGNDEAVERVRKS